MSIVEIVVDAFKTIVFISIGFIGGMVCGLIFGYAGLIEIISKLPPSVIAILGFIGAVGIISLINIIKKN